MHVELNAVCLILQPSFLFSEIHLGGGGGKDAISFDLLVSGLAKHKHTKTLPHLSVGTKTNEVTSVYILFGYSMLRSQ